MTMPRRGKKLLAVLGLTCALALSMSGCPTSSDGGSGGGYSIRS